uniref:Uncharacterized protein gs114 n=1 Tax=Homo sapiens TaxID=9606 RepID=Q96RY6_HUMAN|nr:unknown [Homo sapiens]
MGTQKPPRPEASCGCTGRCGSDAPPALSRAARQDPPAGPRHDSPAAQPWSPFSSTPGGSLASRGLPGCPQNQPGRAAPAPERRLQGGRNAGLVVRLGSDWSSGASPGTSPPRAGARLRGLRTQILPPLTLAKPARRPQQQFRLRRPSGITWPPTLGPRSCTCVPDRLRLFPAARGASGVLGAASLTFGYFRVPGAPLSRQRAAAQRPGRAGRVPLEWAGWGGGRRHHTPEAKRDKREMQNKNMLCLVTRWVGPEGRVASNRQRMASQYRPLDAARTLRRPKALDCGLEGEAL